MIVRAPRDRYEILAALNDSYKKQLTEANVRARGLQTTHRQELVDLQSRKTRGSTETAPMEMDRARRIRKRNV